MSYSIRPEENELRTAREKVEGVLESAKYSLEKDEMLEVSLGASPSQAPGEFGASGVAINSEAAQIYFDPNKESWKDDIQTVTRKIYAKAWFYEKTEPAGFLWQEVLAEALGHIFLEETGEEREIEDKESFEDEWKGVKDNLGEELSVELRENLSWQLKKLIGEKLLEEHELDDFPKLTRSDVEEAGDEIFS
ncbi:MAG: hypothetical protein ABEJ36_06225 [Candidatus Nanosalina sp.]